MSGEYAALTDALIRDAGDLLGPCVHCGVPVKAAADDWIHEHGLYRCQSPDVAYGHLAHPASVPCRADGPNPCLGARVPGTSEGEGA